ncbi:MAG TPA: hypothetical protein DF712_01700 [Balneola sp.]|nr:hypothetical protein [Balneola sp.]
MRTQLLLTFTTKQKLGSTVIKIQNNQDVLYDKIFVLSVDDEDEVLACTYNVEEDRNIPHVENTISVHRKKDSNTLYTINALNQLIRKINNGILDTSYVINWDNYRNSLMLVGPHDPRILETRIYDVIKLK